jgi:hypothetical protein
MTNIDYALVDKAIENPDFFTTLILLFVFIFLTTIILIPIIRWSNKRYDKLIDIKNDDSNQLINIFNELKHHNESSKEQFDFIRNNLNNTTLNDEQAVRLLKAEMWLTSRKKLNFIKDILLNNHIPWREDFIHEKVTLWLSTYSQEYITNFKWFNTNIWDLWRWLDNNFWKDEFKQFVKEITDVMFRQDKWDKTAIIQNKIAEISLLMETLQNKLWLKLKDNLVTNSK